MRTLKYLTYKEWISEHPEVELEIETCPECAGSGATACYHCGHEMECEKCDGDGNIKSAMVQYKTQLENDKKAVEKFMKLMERQPA